MKSGLSIRALVAMLICMGTAALALALPVPGSHPIPPVDLAQETPAQFGRWRTSEQARPIVPDENERRDIAKAYDQSFARVYVRDDGAMVMLVIAHGDTQTGMLAIHRPATCYAAQGFTVQQQGSLPLGGASAQIVTDRMFARRGQRSEPILSWMTIAGQQTGFGVVQNWATLRAAWHGKPAEGFLIRASTLGPNNPASYGVVADFLTDMMTAMPADLRDRLGGAGSA